MKTSNPHHKHKVYSGCTCCSFAPCTYARKKEAKKILRDEAKEAWKEIEEESSSEDPILFTYKDEKE